MEISSNGNSQARTHAITNLFSRYVNGEIRETAWNRFMSVMDSDHFSLEDRSALASFFKDALDEFGHENDIYIPILSEATNVFDDGMRFAA